MPPFAGLARSIDVPLCLLLGYLADDHPHKATKKSSQVGLTVIETLDDIHKAGHRGMNVIRGRSV